MSTISSGVWIYTFVYCEYSFSSLFLPKGGAQDDFMGHMRRALQFDEIFIFSSGFLWLGYLFWDLHSAGFIGSDWVIKAAFLPVLVAVAGPGTAFAAGWYWRESVLQSKVVKK